MKWNWYLPLTEAQFEKLKAGLKSYFRFNLDLAQETVTYNTDTKVLTVYVAKGTKPGLTDDLSIYVNGFSKAIS